MNTKPRSDSKLYGLTGEQRAKLDAWLFTEGLTYKKVVELCAKELGVQVSRAGVCRYFREESERRMAGTIAAGKAGPAVWRLGIQSDEGYRELVQRTGKMALEAARADGRKGTLSRLVELMRLQIAARREANMAQRVALTQEKLEFDAATACLLHQKEIQAIALDDSLDEGDRIRAIREELFGPNLPE